MRIVSTPIGGSGLARLAADKSNRSPWFAPVPQSADEWRERATLVRSALVNSDWLSALAPAFDASGPAKERLARASDSGFAVTTGQQPGLFGGPLYTWWKALSALALADRLQAETGLPVAPIFWAATDDSDYAEAADTIVATQGGFEKISLPPMDDTGEALADIPLGDVSPQLERLIASAGSAPNGALLELLTNAYSSGHTVGTAYVELLRGILEPLGIAVIDAAHPAVRHAAFPVIRDALANAQAIEDSLLSRSKELKESKLAAQVKVVKGRTLVFAEKAGKRDRIRLKDAAAESATPNRGALGPNVLLRPIVERSIIPTVAYIGGPAEVAYFAQVTSVAQAMNTLTPVVIPRWSGFVVEPRIDKILERYEISIENLRDPHAMEMRVARESLPAALMQRISSLRETLTASVAALARAEGADLVSPAVLEGLTRNLSHRLDRLERRYVAAVKRNGNDALREIAVARGSLFPDGKPQERALNGVPLFARHGDELVQSVMAEIKLHFDSI